MGNKSIWENSVTDALLAANILVKENVNFSFMQLRIYQLVLHA